MSEHVLEGAKEITVDEMIEIMKKKVEVKAWVAEAKLLKERFDTVGKTVNNVTEYEKLSARITKGLSYEAYLE